MRFTAVDDGMLRTHDDVAQCLRYAIPGATVVFDPLRWSKRPQVLRGSREFTVVLDGAPHHAINALDTYSLPCKADPLIRRVRDLAESAWAELAKRTPCVTFRADQT